MRQTRLSIGCQDWQGIIQTIGPEAAGVLLYLRTLMRSIQAAEISVTIRELATALHLSDETAAAALADIETAGYLKRTVDAATGIITLRSEEEEKQLSEARRKRAARLLSKFRGPSAGQSEYTFFDNNGQSADSPKEVESEVAMFYHPGPGEPGRYMQSNQYRKRKEREKEPHTPQKEETLTEFQTRTRSNKTCEQPELPADSLEAEYIDVVGNWPKSLRQAVRAEKEDVREAFYLCVRKRQTDEGRTWSADRVRMTWLAARRIPEERRAESILAWGMGNWKTIRDCGSGCYFEKESGHVVSLVRGTVERGPRSAIQRENAELAVELARKMRRE